jgi:molybdate transport system substrate-binding protein
MAAKNNRITRLEQRMSLVIVGALVLLAVLLFLLLKPDLFSDSQQPTLVLFCAAAVRLPMEQIRNDFKREHGVHIDVQYGGSNTLLSQLQLSHAADLYLAADDSYLELANTRGLIQKTAPIAHMVPVIIVPDGNPRGIRGIADLLQEGIRVALGNPDLAAIGKRTRTALRASGHWEAMEEHVTASGVFKPTVPDVANAVKIGSVDAGIVWSATAAQIAGIQAISAPELHVGVSQVAIGITSWSEPLEAALHFVQYITDPDGGQKTFQAMGYLP